MAGENEPPLDVTSFAHQLGASTKILRRQVALANTLAAELAELHLQHAKVGEHLWGRATPLADGITRNTGEYCSSATINHFKLSKPTSVSSGDTLIVEDTFEVNRVGVALVSSREGTKEELVNPYQKSQRRDPARFCTEISNASQKGTLWEPAQFVSGISNASTPVECSGSGKAETSTDIVPSSPRRAFSFTRQLSKRAVSSKAEDCLTSVFAQLSELEAQDEPVPQNELLESESPRQSSKSTCETPPPAPQPVKSRMIISPADIKKRVSISEKFRISTNASYRQSAALEIAGVRLASTSRWVVNPEQSRQLERWDMLAMGSLVFVALVTPVQISMTDCVIECPLLFAVNSIVDLVFLFDLVLQFFLMYPKKTNFGHALEYRHSRICMHYLKTWFAIDFLSIIPFDLISALSDSGELSKMKAVKVVRLIRLLKLVRVLKASRLFRRFEVRMSFTYQRLALLKFFVVLAALTHWMACLWALTLVLVDSESGVPRWVDVFEGEEANIITKTKDSLWKKYIACLYFTSYTITSVGYGDIGPVNIVERIACTVIIFISGISWAMVLGQVCGIVGNMDADEQHFRKIMDELNFMMEDRQLPVSMRRRLRSFFLANKLTQRHKHQRQIVDSMSPGLQGEVIMEMNKVWLAKVTFLNDLLEHPVSDAHGKSGSLIADYLRMFVSDVARGMEYMMFAQGEFFGMYQVLYILNQGLVGRRGRLLHAGAVWGTDFLLSDLSLLHSARNVALTYVSVMILTRTDFMKTLDKYANECHEVQRRVRRYVCWLAVQRGIMAEAKMRIAAKKSGKWTQTAKKEISGLQSNKKQPVQDAQTANSQRPNFSI